jgi:rhamnose transport system permease protein
MNRIVRLIRPEQVREFSLVIIIVLAILFFGTQIQSYYTGRTFTRISTSVAVILVVAVGQTLVVLTRNIDLSVGSIVGFGAYFAGQQLALNNDITPLAAVAIAVGVGLIAGIINGALVAYGRIPSIVVTLGTLALYRGVLVEYSQAQTITTAQMPDWLIDLPRQNLFTVGDLEVRTMVALALVVVIVFQLILRYMSFGRRLFAIGSNPDAARVAGLPSRRVVFMAYVLCGALAGLAGFMFLARFGTITVVAGQGLELSAIAAVVVGGVNLFGGSGSMWGAMLGAIMIGTLEQSLLRMQINEFVKDALLGLFILVAVAADTVIIARLRIQWARVAQRQPAAQAAVQLEHEVVGHAKP